MPYLQRIRRCIDQKYDVIVCGGGPSGFCAAVQCARLGLHTAIVEKYGALGGAMTLGGIPVPALFHAWGKQVISGIGWELMTRLAERRWAELPIVGKHTDHPEMAVKVNALAAACEMDFMCKEGNIDLYLLQPVVDVVCSNIEGDIRIHHLVVASEGGLIGIEGRVYIDCTGNGDIAAWAGMEYEIGDPLTHELQPGTLSFFISGYHTDDIDSGEVCRKFKQALNNGRIMPWDHCPHEYPDNIFTSRGSNMNHILVDGSDSASRTQAEMEGRRSAMRIVEWMRSEVSGAEKAIPVMCCPEVWIRESRRIIGIGYINGDDYINGKIYNDSLCYSFYPVDIHTNDTSHPLVNIYINEDVVPTIPMGAMIPKKSLNLVVAGRCISGDRVAQSAYRVQASCMATGQCAGAIAAESVIAGLPPRDTAVDKVREILRKHKAIVPEGMSVR